MKKFNLALFSDTFFFSLCAFLVTFTVVRYYVKRAVTALIVGIGVAVVCAILVFFLLSKKRRNQLAASLDESKKKTLALHLSVCSQNAVSQMFLKALDGTYAADNRLEDDNFLYFFNFKLAPLNADEVAKVIRVEGTKSKCILCNAASADALSLAEDFGIEIKTIGEVYLLLKEKDALPERYAMGEVKKPSVFRRIVRRFNRKRFASLFFSGLTLLFFSFFTFYPKYYIAVGAILMIAAAACLVISPKKT